MSSTEVQHFSSEIKTLIKWKINDFTTQAPKEKQTKFESDSFSLYRSRLSFYLRFFSTSPDDQFKDHSALYLVPKNIDNEKEVQLEFKFWIENENGKKVGRGKEISYTFKKENFGYGYVDFVKHSELYPPESDFIKNDIIYMCCQIKQNESQQGFNSIPLNDAKIMKHFYKASQNSKSGKLTIQMKNKKSFKIEKALLALNSSVFEQMLGNENFDETKNSSIKIEDFEPEIMEAFVEYTHLEFVSQENAKYAHDLLKLSDKYNVIKLKEECSQILAKTLNKENVLQLLITCFTHDCPQLKTNVLEYLNQDGSDVNFNSIMKTREWKEFALENESVSDEIIDVISMKVKSCEAK